MSIEIGAVRRQEIEIGEDKAITFLGVEGARVLATPWMIGLMERTCRDMLLPMLEEGYDSVGTHVNVWHLAAAPLGSTVVFRSEIESVDDRRVNFKVEAHRGDEKVGEGTHQRFVIHKERFAEKNKERMKE